MAASYEAAKHPLDTPAELKAELTTAYHDTFDTDAIEARLLEAGYGPPDDRDGWTIAYAYGPNGEDIGLVWSEPSYPTD